MRDKTDQSVASVSRREFLKTTVATGAGIAFVGCAVTTALADMAGVAKDPDTRQADYPRTHLV